MKRRSQEITACLMCFWRYQAGAGIGLSYVRSTHPASCELHRLTAFRRRNPEELRKFARWIAELKDILASEKKLKTVIVKELRDVRRNTRTRAAPRSSRTSRKSNLKT